MKRAFNPFHIALLALPIATTLALPTSVSAQNYPPPPPSYPAQAQFSQQDLDQMLAPIALYPDALLSQILMAATYPLEVVEAARWSAAYPSFQGDAAVRAVEQQDWDPSVKSLVAFPQILAMMDAKLDWTQRLGDAFLAQEPQVMDTVQNLRQRAYAAGNLRSNEEIHVISQGPAIVVEPVNPQIVYVPYYDPLVVYGHWWWSAPPVYWAPWRGYYAPRPGFAFSWGVGIRVADGFFFGAFDWPHREARVVHVNNYYYRRTVVVDHRTDFRDNTVVRAPGAWQHDPEHRRGDPYRNADVRARFASQNAPRIERETRPEVRTATPEVRGRNDNRREDAQHQEVRPEQRSENRGNDAPRPAAASRTEPRSAAHPQDNRPQNRSLAGPQETRPESRSNDNNRRGAGEARASQPTPQARVESTRPAPAAVSQPKADTARSGAPQETARGPRGRELRPSEDSNNPRHGDGGEHKDNKERRG